MLHDFTYHPCPGIMLIFSVSNRSRHYNALEEASRRNQEEIQKPWELDTEDGRGSSAHHRPGVLRWEGVLSTARGPAALQGTPHNHMPSWMLKQTSRATTGLLPDLGLRIQFDSSSGWGGVGGEERPVRDGPQSGLLQGQPWAGRTWSIRGTDSWPPGITTSLEKVLTLLTPSWKAG